jgi:MvdD family ATP-grasp ribosomal peptide maturase
MSVLIITHSQDNQSILRVMKGIESFGGKAFRFDTDRFPTSIKLDIYYKKNTQRCILSSDEESLDLNEVSSVWYRRIAIGGKIPTTINTQLRHASVGESSATIQGMIASIQGFHLDPIPHIRRADNKQLQLKVAREVGLEIPETLITNNPQAVREFSQQSPQGIVAKMLSSFAVYDEQGNEQVVFTNPVTKEDLDYLDGLRFCPMTFQENIPKQLELRITIVGKHIFTAAIDSQISDQATYDWRKQGLALMNKWQPYKLPQGIEEKLLKLMGFFNLNYGAIDIIVTPDDKYIFLEINPVGEFFWLEDSPGMPISQAIAEILYRQN